jgi:hypothetical protein
MKLLLLLFGCIFFVSCGVSDSSPQDSIVPVDSVISETQLTDCMVDIFMIEAALFKAQNEGRNIHDYSVLYYRQFFNTHGFTRQKIKMSLEYYISKKRMEYIVQDVVFRLTEIDLQTKPVEKSNDTIQQQKNDTNWIEKMMNPGLL